MTGNNFGIGNAASTSLSAHSDLLDAESPPENPHSFIEEIKRRGKACVLSKNYGAAEALYSKGLEVLLLVVEPSSSSSSATIENVEEELAILYSNRSLVRLYMSKLQESIEDANLAVQHDPNYIKGHWRHGQACIALGKCQEGLLSFQKALQLEPNNKALMREINVTKEKIVEMEKKRMEDETKVGEDEENNMKDVEIQDKVSSNKKNNHSLATKATKKVETKKTTSKKMQEFEVDNEPDTVATDATANNLFTKSDHVRGYKLRSDGTKTSYFDREISEDAKKLIGDIAPKKLDMTSSSTTGTCAGNNTGTDNANATNGDGTSAWNTAGTWEERDVTPWAKESLTSALLRAEYLLPPSSPSPGSHVVVSKVTNLDGHASYATVRGKKRYIYEFEFTIKWILTWGEDPSLNCHGTMTFPDVDGTVELGEGYDIVNYCVEGSTCPTGTGPLLDRFVRDGGFREAIHAVIDDWVRLFRSTY